MYVLNIPSCRVEYDPSQCALTVKTAVDSWKWAACPTIKLACGKTLSFAEGAKESFKMDTGVSEVVEATYSFGEIQVITRVIANRATDALSFEMSLSGDNFGECSAVYWPAAFDFSTAKEGYTMLPRMQGVLVPAGQELILANGIVQERDAYLSLFGQVRLGGGYAAIYDTPWDARYAVDGQNVLPYFVTSLGTMRYERKMTYKFMAKASYVDFCKYYRRYKEERGEIVTLKEKIVRNPNVAKLIGSSILNLICDTRINEESVYFNRENPQANDHFVSFDQLTERVSALKEAGLNNAYVHLDGWGKHGYDHLHPDVFPPSQRAGGTEGMRKLALQCQEAGYVFGIHDNYHDYYADAETYNRENALVQQDGSLFECCIWLGGKQNYLCEKLAPDFVRRNYRTFQELNIPIEGSYIDVFSIIELDECFHKSHPMSRRECVTYRNECYNILTADGIIPSSEEPMDTVLPAIALCHHAPYFLERLGTLSSVPGIAVPLFNLVYHDCIVIPWHGLIERGGWGTPKDDLGFLHGLLNGGIAAFGETATPEEIERSKTLSELHRKVALEQMVTHEFVDGNLRRQRTCFSDGTTVEVDFDTNWYEIRYGEQK